jgi:hypothetical protein
LNLEDIFRNDRLEVPQGGTPMDPIGEQWGGLAGNYKLAYQWLQELPIAVSSDRYITDTLSSAVNSIFFRAFVILPKIFSV